MTRTTNNGRARTVCTRCEKRVHRDQTVSYHYPNRPFEVVCFRCSNQLFETELAVTDGRGAHKRKRHSSLGADPEKRRVA